MSREVESLQMELGASSIASVEFNLRSRDDIPKILRGLQYVYTTESLRGSIFQLLEEKILPNVDKENGRPGMSLWKILVMGVLRLDLNCDYDRLEELVNHHDTVRQILGHGEFSDKTPYKLQTIKDNVRLLTASLLEEINVLIVQSGQGLLNKKKREEPLRGRCDSFVVETDVHYPTDIHLLYDAMRKVIQLTGQLSERHGSTGWRQSKYNIKQIKYQMRAVQKKKRVSGKTEPQKEKNRAAIKEAHQALILLSERFLSKSKQTLDELSKVIDITLGDIAVLESINTFTHHAVRQIDQITRRVIGGETIPHDEKVFSLFQPHTEWVSKGKAGIPVELGLRVCIVEDQHQFILHHRVMEKETDDQVVVSMIANTQSTFPTLRSCSFDKGFHSPENQVALGELLDVVALKRKGKLSNTAKAIEHSGAFKKASDKHAAVESAINALEVHGCDKCKDHGIEGFKCYIALAVVTRNIHRIGDILHKKELAKSLRKNKRACDAALSLAA